MELHDLKLMLQKHLTDGLVTIVGSGLSCAEGLPGMGELASHLDTTVIPGLAAADRDRWTAISPLISAKGLEAALLEVPPTPGLETAIVTRTAELIASRERQIVAEVFSRTRTLRFTRLIKQLLKPQTGLPIVTTNYDRLIEVAVEEAGLGVDTLFVGHFAGELNEAESRLSFCREVTLRGKQVQYRYRLRANVFKPHGSLDWYHRDGKPVRYSGDLDLPRLIITPGLNKFRNGYESPFDRHRERANAAIDRASRFLVIGYGFNDDHLETHLTPRIRSGVPTLLLTHTLSANALKLVAECPTVIAIHRAELGGIAGSSVHVAGVETFFSGLALWDLGAFVAEVLEP
ncbi:SIR2 family protein [Rhodoblastus acidophilus]|uniref:SIR2 family protein n=1 Tax=Candidatus Rhodoblastus alkanivorans TaxID=2954117 RepID=A0ABS9Z368_9HYPH|nr:SIR2 family protein [Candidatus Rhodoblastus alkanivorans]MCI4680924.1 SIR2 family protein [Candidatus Rhodoblastus alkanivorans]MCI4681770.1 SIR2 family protein [Candidatus Rhodoblastus alkanivorans]MDI4642819.1 SIR2 family protein [Rhodoblastus acidophilus]